MSFCTALTVSLSCFAMACPRNDSTLKLLVLVGKIKKATIVVSLFSDYIQTIKSQPHQQANNHKMTYSQTEILAVKLHNCII